MNLTLSVDERLVKMARRQAAAMGKSLNELIRDHLRQITNDADVDGFERELRDLSGRAAGTRGTWTFDRDEIHDRS